jgi:hypothetical protein
MRALLVLCLAAGGCRSRTPTYHRDVAPLIEKHCRECHRPGGTAPVPPLNDYASAKTYAMSLKNTAQTRRMPPWGADNTGECGTWEGARWLSGDEIATFARWYDSGAQEGDPEDPASPQSVKVEPFRADVTVGTGGVYQPDIGPAGSRCFVADPKLERDRLLSAIRVVSTDARAVAQVTLFALDSAAADTQATALDDKQPGLGYACFGTPLVDDARPIASWTWPAPVLRLPAGVRLHAARKVVIQIHYNIAHTGTSFHTATHVELELDDNLREARVLTLSATGRLDPGQRYVAVERRLPVDKRFHVVGIAPRMHIRAETQNLMIERGGRQICLATFDHWHFFNQQLFRTKKPITVEANDKLRISCAYRTLGRAEPVAFGDLIDNEECVAWLYVID